MDVDLCSYCKGERELTNYNFELEYCPKCRGTGWHPFVNNKQPLSPVARENWRASKAKRTALWAISKAIARE